MEASTRKRTHLSSSQVSALEASFKENSLPDSTTRSRLAKELSVTERTVQIWFQNRRAKEKKMRARFTEEHKREPTAPRYQPTFRSMMTPEAFEQPNESDSIQKRPRSISKPEKPKASLQLTSEQEQYSRALSEGLTSSSQQAPSLGSKHVPPVIPLAPNLLRIGTWTRFSSEQHQDWDLCCYAAPSDRMFVWKVKAGQHQFKIEILFDQIQYIHLHAIGQLDIHLSSLPLSFAMLRYQQDQDWVPCGDFTEMQQASMVPIHTLQGNYESFKYALLDLMVLAPELSTKLINTVDLPGLDDIGREYTLSPSATPEPFMMQYTESSKLRANTTPIHHLMLQAPFFYPTQSPLDEDMSHSVEYYTPPPPLNSYHSSFI
ncbi:hypothetical protein RMATCC62417_11611 [Rhizopus microsporus]|nr:hypothetical protein RMATCC62417_11611 [Rhizopus microsporus]